MDTNAGKFGLPKHYGTIVQSAIGQGAGGHKDKPHVEQPEGKPRSKEQVRKYYKLFLIPFAMFFVCSYSYAFLHFANPGNARLLIAGCVAVLLWSFIRYQKAANPVEQMPEQFMVQSVFISIFSGICFGLFIFHYFFHGFFATTAAQTYANVVPSQPAGGIADAGEIAFAVETRVDSSRSIGFMDRGNMYCVAPVVDQPTDKNIQFWAIGENCCAVRGNFACNEGDIPNDSDGNQKTALVELFPDEVWEKAKSLALAENSMSSAEGAIFVRIMPDILGHLQIKWRWGIAFYILGILGWLAVCHNSADTFAKLSG